MTTLAKYAWLRASELAGTVDTASEEDWIGFLASDRVARHRRYGFGFEPPGTLDAVRRQFDAWRTELALGGRRPCGKAVRTAWRILERQRFFEAEVVRRADGGPNALAGDAANYNDSAALSGQPAVPEPPGTDGNRTGANSAQLVTFSQAVGILAPLARQLGKPWASDPAALTRRISPVIEVDGMLRLPAEPTLAWLLETLAQAAQP